LNERIARLRERYVQTSPSVSVERARLLTEFERSSSAQGVPVPVRRALAFRYILERQTIHIGPDEWIVGERGPEPLAASTFPELCCHSLDDLETLDTRSKTPFRVDPQAREIYVRDIIPFWEGRSIREQLFASMSEPWHDAFDAGVFTEFMEQRAPGHAVLDDKIYHAGFLDFKGRIQARQAELTASDGASQQDLDELEAMSICCDAIIRFAERHAELAESLAEAQADPSRRRELEKIARVCRHVPARAPRTFHEAVQMYWFTHLGVIIELNEWDSFNPGRLDQHLVSFYRDDLAQGRITREEAKELLSCLWLKISSQPAPPKVGVTEEQSATYNDFTLINAGGLTPTGGDGVNEISYLILDVIDEMRLPYTGSCIQISKANPDRFLHRALQIVRSGFGQPSIFNTDAILQEFLRAGKSIEDARCGGPSGCVTISAFGKESCVLTGYVNWPKILELAMNDGVDPRTGKRIGLSTGTLEDLGTFDALIHAYNRQLRYFVDLKIEGNTRIEELFRSQMPAPFLSVLVDDCIERASDYNDAGPRYPTTYIQGVGLATTIDALAAIREHVYDQRTIAPDDLLQALRDNFSGRDQLRTALIDHSPRFGNDDDRADTLAETLFDMYYQAIDGRPNSKGGAYRINLLPTTVHVFFGEMVGALPNGRLAGKPLSDGISPSQGADRYGPTAVLHSTARIDHVRTGGTLLNQRFLPDVLRDDAGLKKVAALVRTYFRWNGHHIQFNVVDSATLRNAQKDPGSYRDLIVRVAGYSDYFVNLDSALQDEIIARTAHESAG